MSFTPYTCTSPDDPARADDGLFGPGSVTWRIMNSRIMWVAALRALYLQALHPRVVRGTLQNAPGITQAVDGWARLRRTRKFIETRTFGTMTEAERAGAPRPHHPPGAHRKRRRWHAVPARRARPAAVGALRRGVLLRGGSARPAAAGLRRRPRPLRGRAARQRGAHRHRPGGCARLDGRTRRLLRADQAAAVRGRRGETGAERDHASSGC